MGARPDRCAERGRAAVALGDLVKNVGFRDLNGRLSCIVGIGRALWDRLSPGHRPLDLHAFAPIHGPVHTAPSTPGDLLFHIRAEREDMTFEFERQLLDVLGDAATVVDETTGFRYFDARDLLGFVDGTANPTGAELPDAALIGEDADPDFAGRADPDAAGRAGDGGPGERVARHRLAARRDLTRHTLSGCTRRRPVRLRRPPTSRTRSSTPSAGRRSSGSAASGLGSHRSSSRRSSR
jgi:hypothetical protein